MQNEELIGLLISNPKSEREIGFNDAVIQILKKTVKLPTYTREQLIHDHLLTIIHCDHPQVFLELVDAVVKKEKLRFVKIYNDLRKIGLRESKEFADMIWSKFY